ncbi:MAG TPA: NACHT domain-containing protein, partial [Candidatus Deferrimicrobium sp.]|nr:NACHT domain-containing protein [Candidatus Deferrimicrobium sp.]
AVFARLVKEYARKQEPMKLVILGQPGSGKTTLMKWIALQCACRKEDVFAHFIPVFIPLKDLGREPEKTYRAKNIRDLTMDMLERETISPSFIKDSFENNQLLFLLDGLDEVAEEDRRREVIDWIQRQNIRKNALLVTSRFSGLQEAKGLKFHDAVPVFEVQNFDIADIEGFLENWYQNIEVAVAGAENKNGAVQKGKKEYEHLMEIIKSENHENLRKLAVNPLLLTIIAIVHRTRAVLPKERHKLYEECLKVMIELWNVANRKLDVSFTVENSLDNLSNLAVFLMTENRREMELREIEDQLPGEIEGKSLDFFLKEMVLKAGLLYESEGKYGFLHLTFQEYLAAWHFARGKDQNAILAFRDKDYWTETFKLFVNIANAHMFFKEIIANLLEEEYWRQMQLWDDCLADIVVEKSRGDIEIEFAQRILNILPGIEYREENEPLIIQLYVHYPLYKYADQFVKEGWHLFHHALHPFVRSVGSLILNLAGGEAQMQLIGALKARVNEFEKQETKDPGTLMEFLYRNNNSLMLLLYGRRNARDFNFVLAKLKSPAFFIIYLLLRELREDLQYFRELRDLRELRCLRDILDLRELREFRELKDLLDPLEGVQDRLDLRYIKYLRYFRYLRDQYLEKYQAIIEKHKPEIDAWTDQAMAKLHSLTDEELLKYFPNTSSEDLKTFRTHYPPFIAAELKKGNDAILKELHINHELLEQTEKLVDTQQGQGAFYQVLIKACADNSPEMKAQRKPIIQYLLDKEKLTIDRPTILGLLNFDIDLDNEENQALELNAFYYLSDKDWAKLRELVVGVVEIPPNQTIGLNAVYIFKYIN